MLTSLAWTPVDRLWFYINKQNWTLLYPNATAKEVNVSTPVGEQTSFLTGSTIAGSASVYHYVQGGYAVRLNKVYPVVPQQVEIGVDMSVATVATRDYMWEDRIWGKGLESAIDNQEDFPLIWGIPRDVPWYTPICSGTGEDKHGAQNPRYAKLNKHIQRFTWTDKKGETFTYSYCPLNGTLRIPKTNTINMKLLGVHAGSSGSYKHVNLTRGASETEQIGTSNNQYRAEDRIPKLDQTSSTITRTTNTAITSHWHIPSKIKHSISRDRI
ncbi:hypothetical protein PR048_010296 [Dryococelus australis]|uniref:Uncharacterized protein n=1 Tax=Dryococelus australis TaxID=614101 RepID=A0ABQ9I2G2_9NEOP|nr:hypothetical protein PR048_010296 [Dryococelus australis]